MNAAPDIVRMRLEASGRPRRVAAVTASLSRTGGGLSEAVRALSHAFQRAGRVETHALGVADPDFATDRALWRGIATTGLAAAGPRAFAYAPRLADHLEQIEPDVVHVHGLWTYPSFAGARWAHANGRPLVISPHGMLDAWAMARSRLKKRLAWIAFQKAALKRASCLHALCDAEADAIRATGLSNPICIAPNGVDLPPPAADGEAATWAKELRPGEKALVFLGRIHPKKNLPALMRAMADLPDRRGWRLVVAGWDQGGHEAELRATAHALGLADAVSFVGPQFGAEKIATLRAADAFVLPSLSEGQPMAVLEAWSCAAPVLMTPQCNLPEGFAAGAAIAAEPDEAGLREGMRTLFRLDDEERARIGRRGLQLVESRFAWSASAQRLSDVYRWLCEGGDAPECVRL